MKLFINYHLKIFFKNKSINNIRKLTNYILIKLFFYNYISNRTIKSSNDLIILYYYIKHYYNLYNII